MEPFVGGSQTIRGTLKGVQSNRTFLIKENSSPAGKNPPHLCGQTQEPQFGLSKKKQTKMVWGGATQGSWNHHLKILDSYQAASPRGKTDAASRQLHIAGKKAALTQSLLWASWRQGCESKTQPTLLILDRGGGISKPALCRAYLFKRVGEGSRGSRSATVTGCIITSFACFFTPECVFCNQDIQVSASFWRIWSLSEITVQIKAFCSY